MLAVRAGPVCGTGFFPVESRYLLLPGRSRQLFDRSCELGGEASRKSPVENLGDGAVVPEGVFLICREACPDRGAVLAEIGDDRSGVVELVGAADAEHLGPG